VGKCVQLIEGMGSFVDAIPTLGKIANQLKGMISSIEKEEIRRDNEKRYFEEFNRHQYPTFRGDLHPSQAKDWFVIIDVVFCLPKYINNVSILASFWTKSLVCVKML